MPFKKLEVRGCCMGIPFGCGTLFMLFVGVALSQPLSHFALAAALTAAASTLTVTLSALFALGWFQEKQDKRKPCPVRSSR